MAKAVAEQPELCLDDKNRELMGMVGDRKMSARDRASNAVFNITEYGMDFIPAMTQMIMDRDESGGMDEMIKELGKEPLNTERYIGPAKMDGVGKLGRMLSGTTYAWVTAKDGMVALPVSTDVKGLQQGDMVLISGKVQRIIGKDAEAQNIGIIVTVEAIPETTKGQIQQIIVKIGELVQSAWLHHSLLANPPAIGSKVIYDEKHRFVVGMAHTETKGEELLSNIDSLQTVRRHQVGSPHPVAEQVVNHFRDAVEHPEWLKQLGSRDRKSYLFVGGTGGGKSYHIKLISTEIHDLVEQYTGQRQSRVFLCDASQFWSPYFGETEQRITAWAKKIEALGQKKVISKDGKEIAMPILGVIEECEALFRTRGGDQNASGHLFDRVLSLLLQKLESAENAIGVPIVWVCSTNRPDLIDAAAMRRIGMRKAIFGNLKRDGADQVLVAKTSDLGNVGTSEDFIQQVVDYIYDSEDGQKMAEVTFQDRSKRILHRRDVVTPAVLEEAVSSAVDQCMTKSREAKKLQRVSAADVISFLDNHFRHLARTLTEYNVPEHCPEWFAEDAIPVGAVKVLK